MNQCLKREILSTLLLVFLFGGSVASAANSMYQFQQGVVNGLTPSTTYLAPSTSLNALLPTNNYGTSTNLMENCGNYWGFVQFNMSAAAAAANTQGVLTSTLTLTTTAAFGSSYPSDPVTFTVYAMPSGNTAWTNITATYNYQNQSLATPWINTNGTNAANGTAAALTGRVVGSWTGALPNAAGIQIPISLDPTIIAQMLNTPAQNEGFLIVYSSPHNSGTGNFASSANVTSSTRPLLTIEIPTLRTQVDISQPPYNATTSMSDVGPIIQQAINDMLALGGGTVYIPAGNWNLYTPISITSATAGGSLILRGDGAHVAGASGGTALIWTKTDGSTDAITVDGTSNPTEFMRVFIRNLAIDGTSSFPNNHNGLVLKNANTYQLDFVTVTGFNAAGIVINNSWYGSINDADIGSCGTGVDCTTANADQFLNISVHNCLTQAMHNPQSLVGCCIENNNKDGIVLDASGLALSLHDCYFANNNATNTVEGADIWASSGTPTLAISGHSEFNGKTSGGESSIPYRRLRGTFDVVTRSGAAHFLTTTLNASFDVTNTIFKDASTEQYPNNLSWKTGTTGNTYKWNFSGVGIVNVQFGQDGTNLNGTSWSSTVAPLAYTGTTWTNDSTSGLTMTNLSYSDGTSSTIGFSLSSGFNHPQAETNPLTLLKSLVYTGAGTGTITFTGLNNSQTYDIYIASNANFAVDTWTIGSTHLTTTADTTQTSWVSGVNYVHFANVVPTSGQIVATVTGGGMYPGYVVISGFQVVTAGQPITNFLP